MVKKGVAFCLFFCFSVAMAQTRITEHYNIGWFAANASFQLSNRFGLHTEYQWRRVDYGEHWQQGLLRLGLNYKLSPETLMRVGYAWAETFPYGDIPLNAYGKKYNEHRAFEMISISDKVSVFELTHRFMLEQRWIGRYSNASLTAEDSYPFVNRIRYQIRVQYPILKDGLYAAVYDEIFIGFGKNVRENIFDQNRFGAIVGYPINKNLKIEGGYLSQIVQLGREVDNKNVFQHNNGFIVSAILNFDLRKSETPK